MAAIVAQLLGADAAEVDLALLVAEHDATFGNRGGAQGRAPQRRLAGAGLSDEAEERPRGISMLTRLSALRTGATDEAAPERVVDGQPVRDTSGRPIIVPLPRAFERRQRAL